MKRFIIFIIFLMSSVAMSSPKYEVKNISLVKENQSLKIQVDLTANTKLVYAGEIRDNIFQVELNNAFVWPKIEKKVSITSLGEVTLTAYQFDSNTVRVRAIAKKKIIASKDSLTFTKGRRSLNAEVRLRTKKENGLANKNKYDESYLNKLLEDNKQQNHAVKKVVRNENLNQVKSDTVSFFQSANKRSIVDPLANPQQESRGSGIY